LDHLKVTLKSTERGEEETPAISREMELLRCDVAFPMQYKTVDGMVLFGSRRRFDRLADEQIKSLSVVIDQFAATLQNFRDEELRRHAERRSLQQEKLSTLGLISGSLAHELRNPLSSIRTIASLVSEELPSENPNQHDLRLIVSEVDRLAKTLQRMLEFAKPAKFENEVTEPDRVISRLLSIMDYYAKELRIKLDVRLNAPESKVLASDATMNEIFMNLIKNAMEAAKDCHEATVRVISETMDSVYRVTITDNGTGISSDRLANIFLPFETSKTEGTGLGLYIVSERVRELHGTIRVTSEIGGGSTFIVELPQGES
jgi:signal transduction histidine kinase